MITVIITAFIGLCLICLEFFVPGAIIGGLGALFILCSLVLFGMMTTHIYYFILFLALLIVLITFVIKIGLNRTKKVISLHGDQAGFVASSFEKSLIGKEGIVLSDLKPSGHIQIDHESYQAVSESLYIKQGTHILVIGGRGSYLIVKEVSL
jgi:membrane-bound serine protease (ClpP class)